MINIRQLREDVIRPTLDRLGLASPAAEALLIGTALQESRCTYLRQIGGGPALGIYQMEPATHNDIWANFLAYKAPLREKVEGFLAPGLDRVQQLVGNLSYATAMARIHYRRVNEPLPEATDLEGLARYWKEHYNTSKGAGTVAEFMANWQRAFA